MVMLDTNICIYILNSSPPRVKERLKLAKDVSISAIVFAELNFGIKRSPEHLQSVREARLLQFVSLLKMRSWNGTAAVHYADIRASLQSKGTPIGNMDLWIAAHARSLNETLVSNNLRKFERVDGLKLENWADRTE